jgi:hypothetical protein
MRDRAFVAGMAAFVAALCAAAIQQQAPHPSDLAQLHAAARAWLAGQSPYDIVGPGRAFDWPWLLLYPFPAVLVLTPFAWLPLWVVDPLAAAVSVGLYAWSVPRTAWWGLGSLCLLNAVMNVQWPPILVAAALTPALGWMLACKPTMGGALLVAYPSRPAVVGVAAFGLLSLVAWPAWPWAWRAAVVAGSGHMQAPVTWPGGWLLLLAWVQWRDPRARLLGMLALVPGNGVPYEALPLFLIPETPTQARWLCVASWAVIPSNLLHLGAVGPMLLLYLPCLGLVLWPRVQAWRRAPGSATLPACVDS